MIASLSEDCRQLKSVKAMQSIRSTNARDVMQRRISSGAARQGGAPDWGLLCPRGESSDKTLSSTRSSIPSVPTFLPLHCLSQSSSGSQPRISASPGGLQAPRVPPWDPHRPAHISAASKMQMSLALCKLVSANAPRWQPALLSRELGSVQGWGSELPRRGGGLSFLQKGYGKETNNWPQETTETVLAA